MRFAKRHLHVLGFVESDLDAPIGVMHVSVPLSEYCKQFKCSACCPQGLPVSRTFMMKKNMYQSWEVKSSRHARFTEGPAKHHRMTRWPLLVYMLVFHQKISNGSISTPYNTFDVSTILCPTSVRWSSTKTALPLHDHSEMESRSSCVLLRVFWSILEAAHTWIEKGLKSWELRESRLTCIDI